MVHYQQVILYHLAFLLGLVVLNLYHYSAPRVTTDTSDVLVTVCIPARNEQSNIAECLQCVVNQAHRSIEVFVLDDCSDDDTASIVLGIAAHDPRVHLLQGKPIEAGWAGKCHACAQLALHGGGEFILFLDADTRCNDQLVSGLLAAATKTNADLVSGFPQQLTLTFWERIVLPMLQFLITTLLPVKLVSMHRSPAFCAACGQVLFVGRRSYVATGGHTAIRTSFHDGLQIARRFKRSGRRVELTDVSSLISCRMYAGGSEVWNGFTRNAYEGLGSIGVLIVMTLLLALLFVGPYIFLVAGYIMRAPWAPLCLAQVAIIVFIRILQARRFGHWLSVILMPLSVVSIIVIQWGSLFRRKGVWRGRDYSPLKAKPTG